MTEEHLCGICGSRHRRGLGGTALPRIFGLVPKTNALDVYHAYTRPPQPDEDREERESIHILRGRTLEPMALPHFWAHTGWSGRAAKGLSEHPDFPAFLGHRDFIIFADDKRLWKGEAAPDWMKGTGVGETKAPSKPIVQKVIDEGLRQSELLQAYTYAAVERRSWACMNYFTLEHEAGPTIAIPVELPQDLGQFLLEAGQRFWDEHVVKRVPPDPDEWRLMAREDMPPLPVLGDGERLAVKDHAVVQLAQDALEARDLRKRGNELYDEKVSQLEAALVKLGCKKFDIEGVGRFSIVQKEGGTSFQRKALRLARPLDWDLVRTHLLAQGMPIAEADGKLAEMELDLARFERENDPSQYVYLPRASE